MGCNSSSNAKPPVPSMDTDAANTSTQVDLKQSRAADEALHQSQGPAASEVPAKDVTIYLVYYSTYGHVEELVRRMEEAIKSTGVKTKCWQVPETLPDDVLKQRHAPQKPRDHAVISPEQLTEADGLVFAFPTHFGSMPAQMLHFFAATGGFWKTGGLVGKPVTLAVSTAAQAGGQETTMLNAATLQVHHGAILVPFGYTAADILLKKGDEVRGGGPWGAGTLTGADGSRKPSAAELELARLQGVYFAGKVQKLAR